ncbi:DoxX family protein [Phycicoccus sp. Soil802]|uniref:DoxX family protein n=1 Tax=Phycicoccus sp. Soil802 TaxID=1736414 RepID=UPI001F398BDC|nr:DoxX family protein [Phycicoccus sp. Soil802]
MRETMNTVLWIVQIILAVAFGVAGVLKSTRGRALEGTMPWVEDFSDRTVRFIGVMELLGAIGLVLPAATGIAAWLTPLAATGLVVVQVLAVVTHLRRKEPQVVPVNVVLGLLAAFVAWQRFGPHSL